jgi:hypothetical protein
LVLYVHDHLRATGGWKAAVFHSIDSVISHLLNEYGIEHEAEEFNGLGDAYWGKSSRMTKEVLPFLAEHLETGPQ